MPSGILVKVLIKSLKTSDQTKADLFQLDIPRVHEKIG